MPVDTPSAEPTGPLDLALAHGARLLSSRPDLAEQQAAAILEAAPGHPPALRLLGVAKRMAGDPAAARAVLEGLVTANPRWAAAHYELGLTLAALNEDKAATASFGRAVGLKPDFADAWRALGDQLTVSGDARGADHAYARHIAASVNDPRLMAAAQALVADDLPTAEHLLRDHLRSQPTDVAAMRMLAEVGGRLGRYADAELLLDRALELAPGFAAARHNRAIVLHRQEKSAEAVVEIDILLKTDPKNPGYLNLKAAALGRLGDYDEALKLYDQVLKVAPDQPKVWMSYGHALKTAGRTDEGIAAYRKSLGLEPSLGEAYWSLANLKTFRFHDGDVAAMEAQLSRSSLNDDDRLHLHYALGKAFEDAERWAESFEHYAAGAKIRRGQIDYDADETSRRVERSRALYTRAFFDERAHQGAPDWDPIFIVGLPRSGSTLIEQILASHSKVEGTMELTEIITIARELAGRRTKDEPSKYPESVGELDGAALKALGERFIERTRVQRKTDKPRFIDKMPNNFAHVGLIRLILPNATIIDARRHPMATCFSAFKQHFARGQNFSYDLTEVGRYWADYARLMDDFAAVQPHRAYTIRHEDVVADPEREIRALLSHCGLEMEDQCLRFWETERAVRTASSEQVRRPISTEGLEQWRHYEPWLGPLAASLGSIVDDYSNNRRKFA